MSAIIVLFVALGFGCIAAKKNIETTTEIPQQEQRCIPKSPEIIILESGHQGRQGEERSCYENGEIKSILYWEQDKVAESTNFYQNGIRSSNEKLKDGQFTGQRTWWYENGNKRFSVFYNENGQKSGVESWWYENGKIKSQVEYQNGKPLNETKKEWTSNGELK